MPERGEKIFAMRETGTTYREIAKAFIQALNWGIFKWPQLGDFGWPPGV